MDPEIRNAIEDIKSEIINLNQLLRNLSNVVSDIGDEALNAMGVAEKNIEATKKDTKATEKSTKATEKSTKATEEATRATEASIGATEEATKATKELTAEERKAQQEAFVYRRLNRSAFRDLTQEMMTTRGMFGRLEENLIKSVKGNQEYEAGIMILSAALRGASDAVVQFGKAMYQGQQGALIMGSTFENFAHTLGTALKGIGLAMLFIPGLGKVIGLAGLAARGFGAGLGAAGIGLDLLGKATRLATEQSDRLYRVYQDLATAGVAASDGMLGLARDAQELGYGLDDAGVQAFSSLMKTAAADLALMSGSVRDGRRRFVEFNRIVRDDVGRELQNLGMAPEAINESVAAFVANQTRLGRAATMTNQELRQGAVAYIKQLDILAKLTGQDAKSIQARMDADAREERFRAALLQVERTQGKEAADTLRLNMAALGSRFPELAAGLKDMAGGFINTEAARKVFQMGIQRIPEDMTRTLGGGLQDIGRAAKRTSDQFGETLGAVGAFGNVFGNLAELVEAGQLSQHDYNKLLEAAIKTQRDQKAGADGIVAAQTNMRREQMDVRDSLQDLVKAGVAPATKALEGLTGAANRVVQGAERAAGISPPPGDRTGDQGGGFIAGTFGRLMKGLGIGPRAGRTGMGGQPGNIEDLFEFRGGTTGNLVNLQRLDPSFRDNLVAMAQEYNQLTGKRLPFGSGQRSQQENVAVGGAQQSRHLTGRAADLSTTAVSELQSKGLLEKYGFRSNPAAGAWHIEGYRYGGTTPSARMLDEMAPVAGVASGPKSGYDTKLHGNEAVIPLDDTRKIPMEMPNFDINLREQIKMQSAQLARLDDIVSVMRGQMDISRKILQSSYN